MTMFGFLSLLVAGKKIPSRQNATQVPDVPLQYQYQLDTA